MAPPQSPSTRTPSPAPSRAPSPAGRTARVPRLSATAVWKAALEVDASDWVFLAPPEAKTALAAATAECDEARDELERVFARFQRLVNKKKKAQRAAATAGEPQMITVMGDTADGPDTDMAAALTMPPDADPTRADPAKVKAVSLVRAFLDTPDNGEMATVVSYDAASTGAYNEPATELVRAHTRFVTGGPGPNGVDPEEVRIMGPAIIGTRYE